MRSTRRSVSGVITAMPIMSPTSSGTGRDENVGEIELRVGDQQQRNEQGDGSGADAAAASSSSTSRRPVEADVEREHSAGDRRHGRIADRDDGGDAEDDRPRQAAAQDRDLGEDHAANSTTP